MVFNKKITQHICSLQRLVRSQPFSLNITHSLLGIYHHRVHGEHREKIENEKSLSIFKKILCLVFSIPLPLCALCVLCGKILAGTAGEIYKKEVLGKNWGRFFCTQDENLALIRLFKHGFDLTDLIGSVVNDVTRLRKRETCTILIDK